MPPPAADEVAAELFCCWICWLYNVWAPPPLELLAGMAVIPAIDELRVFPEEESNLS